MLPHAPGWRRGVCVVGFADQCLQLVAERQSGGQQPPSRSSWMATYRRHRVEKAGVPCGGQCPVEAPSGEVWKSDTTRPPGWGL